MSEILTSTMRETVLHSGQMLWIATDILRRLGERHPSSRSPGYRRAVRVLASLEKEGYLERRYFPSVNLTVYWKIP